MLHRARASFVSSSGDSVRKTVRINEVMETFSGGLGPSARQFVAFCIVLERRFDVAIQY